MPSEPRTGAEKLRVESFADLGGEDNVSVQQSALIGFPVKSKLLLDTIDASLLTPPTLIKKHPKKLSYLLCDNVKHWRMDSRATCRSWDWNAGTKPKPFRTS
jgi:hypothetical protein